MLNVGFKETILRLLPQVQTPAQYIGGELNSVVKHHRKVRGKLCLAFPDLYTLGMSHHGLQVLYTIMNNDPQWACERAFAPLREFGPPALDMVAPMPYVAVQQLLDEPNPKGMQNYWSADFYSGLPDDALDDHRQRDGAPGTNRSDCRVARQSREATPRRAIVT